MDGVFTVQERSRLRDQLVELARAEPDITAAAVVGSTARGKDDPWSDIDLVLQLAEAGDEPAIVERWTQRMRKECGVADTLDVFATGVRYRVFLLTSSLQVVISFWPHERFRAANEGFRLVFGSAKEPAAVPEPDVSRLIGMGWLYALHARSALARGKLWQCVMMLDDVRNQVVSLACLRHDLDPWHGRDVDQLPAGVRDALLRSRAVHVTGDDLARSKDDLIEQLMTEIELHDAARAMSLREPFRSL